MDNCFFFFFLSQQSKLVMEGFRSLKEGEQVEFTYKKSSKGLESLRVTGPGGGPCAGSERRPKGKVPLQKRKPKGDRWVWRKKKRNGRKEGRKETWKMKRGMFILWSLCLQEYNDSYARMRISPRLRFIQQNLNVPEHWWLAFRKQCCL